LFPLEPGPTIRILAALKPSRLAVMHGSSYSGHCAAAVSELAVYYETAHAAKNWARRRILGPIGHPLWVGVV
jgi:hypothetical protein